jgi:hypothetical protein
MTAFSAYICIAKGSPGGFANQYGVRLPMYYEQHATALAAIQREKNIKHWSRSEFAGVLLLQRFELLELGLQLVAKAARGKIHRDLAGEPLRHVA